MRQKLMIGAILILFALTTLLGGVVIGSDSNTDLSILITPQVDDNGHVKDSLIGQALRPVMEDVVRPVKSDVSKIVLDKKFENTERAVAAYTKIKTLEDLKNNPTNMINIKMGLIDDDIYKILLTMDRERTTIFYNYLIKNSI